ncbi:MAG TPA: enoyl-CoA hydratase/isomerase family protein [Pyrinomonadaceae bacterium]|nr:enoyl-CoA hydratase/isomerase family protein [Pyrinomonadaceae bacterium]
MPDHISLTIDDRVARITLARPPLNILNIAMMREINTALGECGRRDLVGIVFAAAPDCRAFSAGVAIEEHVDQLIYQMLDAFHSIFRSLEQLAKPTLALVDGAALGGGCELVAACDIVIASDRARFGQPEIKIGAFPPVAAVVLPLVIGEKRARELILTGEVIDAADALRLGLCNYVVQSSALEQKLAEVLTKLKEHSGAALEFARRALDLGRGRTIDRALKEVEDIYLHELMKSSDATEGVKAFLEKRKPAWRNR